MNRIEIENIEIYELKLKILGCIFNNVFQERNYLRMGCIIFHTHICVSKIDGNKCLQAFLQTTED